MKRAFKKIGLICTVLVFLPFISSLPIPLNQQLPQQTNLCNAPEIERIDKEILKPSNWIARGGCWDFLKKIITVQGIGPRPIAYLKNKNYNDFKFQIKLRILTEQDGSYGMVFRFDEKKDVGYAFGVYPNGSYEFARLEEGLAHLIGGGQAVYLTDQLKTWNTLTVVCKGPKIDLYINDNLLVSARDNAYKSGKPGLYMSGGPKSILEYEVLALLVL